MLFRRFHENVLNNFGFKQPQAQFENHYPPLQPTQSAQLTHNNSYVGSERDRSAERMPAKGSTTTNTMGNLSSQATGIVPLPSNLGIRKPAMPVPVSPITHSKAEIPRNSEIKQPESHRSVNIINDYYEPQIK